MLSSVPVFTIAMIVPRPRGKKSLVQKDDRNFPKVNNVLLSGEARSAMSSMGYMSYMGSMSSMGSMGQERPRAAKSSKDSMSSMDSIGSIGSRAILIYEEMKVEFRGI